ncbi:MAG: hypothetical protein MZV65_20880 [Chromatiales bacterium]|nr:hypothetical protein [Chromatiales bacterium]
MNIVNDATKIHFAYTNMDKGWPKNLPADANVLQFDSRDGSRKAQEHITDYVRKHSIDVAFGFDQPVWRPAYRTLRRAGITCFLSYWGAPISSLNSGLKLLAKKLEVKFLYISLTSMCSRIRGWPIRPRRDAVFHPANDCLSFRSRY